MRDDKEKRNAQSSILRNYMDKIDLFKQPLPGFNIRGRTNVSSIPGGIVSLFMLLILLFYAALKF